MAHAGPGLRLEDIVARLGGTLRGDGACRVFQVASLENAGPEHIAFLANPRFQDQLKATRAAAVILPPESADAFAGNCIVTPDPYAYYARVAQALNPHPAAAGVVHPSAVVESALAAAVDVGAGTYIGAGAHIGTESVIGPNCCIGAGVSLGEGSRLYANVTIYAGCRIGRRAIIHSGVVIGSDGFGFAREHDGTWVKIPQLGSVVIGDDVEIGANTTIDRGALNDTVIEDGVKLDNQIQIGHNCRIGAHTAIAGCTGIAGSTHIGKRCRIGGAAMVIGHIRIADDVVVSGATFVHKSIVRAGHYTGAVPNMKHDEWLRNFAQLRHLQSLADRIRALEARLQEREKKT